MAAPGSQSESTWEEGALRAAQPDSPRSQLRGAGTSGATQADSELRRGSGSWLPGDLR